MAVGETHSDRCNVEDLLTPKSEVACCNQSLHTHPSEHARKGRLQFPLKLFMIMIIIIILLLYYHYIIIIISSIIELLLNHNLLLLLDG